MPSPSRSENVSRGEREERGPEGFDLALGVRPGGPGPGEVRERRGDRHRVPQVEPTAAGLRQRDGIDDFQMTEQRVNAIAVLQRGRGEAFIHGVVDHATQPGQVRPDEHVPVGGGLSREHSGERPTARGAIVAVVDHRHEERAGVAGDVMVRKTASSPVVSEREQVVGRHAVHEDDLAILGLRGWRDRGRRHR